MRDEELRRDLDRLIRRIQRLEDHLQLDPLDEPPAEQAPPPPAPPSAPETPPSEPAAPVMRPPVPVPPPGVTPPPAAPGEKARKFAAAAAPTPPTVPPVAPPAAPEAPTRAPAEGRTTRPIEVFIGAKLAAWAGAVVIVIAAALFIALGFELGWWGAMSPTLRCLLVAGFGILLLIGGEAALRRIGKAASVGLFGAGLGVLYLDAYATTRFFDLLSEPVAFGLMAIVAGGGFAITLRTRFKTIGVLSLIGGYLTPMLFYGTTGHDLLLMVYLTALLAIALGLSAVQPKQYRLLRYLALGLHMFVALNWLTEGGQLHGTIAIVFMSMWWSMLLIETLLAAVRDQSRKGNAIAVLIATAGYVTAGCWIIGETLAGPDWLGMFTLAIALLGAAAAFQFGPGVEALRGIPRTAMDLLAVTLWAQSGVLLTVAAALQFDGFGASVAWLAIAVAAVEVSRHLRARSVAVFGMIVGALALGRIALLDRWISPGMDNEIWVGFESAIIINQWSILVLIAVAAAHVAAQRLRTEPPAHWRTMTAVLAAVGTVTWLALCYVQCAHLWATGGWLLAAAVLLSVERFGGAQRYLHIAIFIIAAAALKWTAVDALSAKSSIMWSEPGIAPVLNWQMAPVAIMLLLAYWARRIMMRTGEATRFGTLGGQIVTIGGWVLLLIAVSFEIDRVIAQMGEMDTRVQVYGQTLLRGLCWTGLWALGGFALMTLARRAGKTLQFGAGWIILVLSAITWLTYETLIWRFTEGLVPAWVVANMQFGAGALLLVLLAFAVRFWLARRDIGPGALGEAMQHAAIGFALIALLGLWLGSLEIDRVFGDDVQATHGGLSVYWALYAVALVIVGFIKRAAAARYAGLALLAITVGKVLFIDLATIEAIWRVVSFAVSGVLLVGTSLLYSWLSPRILASVAGEEENVGQSEA